MTEKIITEDDWYAFSDGWAIVGWCFRCKECNLNNEIVSYCDGTVDCKGCGTTHKNMYNPDDEKEIVHRI